MSNKTYQQLGKENRKFRKLVLALRKAMEYQSCKIIELEDKNKELEKRLNEAYK